VIEFGVPTAPEAACGLIIKLRFGGLTCAFAVEPRTGADLGSVPARADRPTARDWCSGGDLYEIFVRTFGFIRLTFAISRSLWQDAVSLWSGYIQSTESYSALAGTPRILIKSAGSDGTRRPRRVPRGVAVPRGLLVSIRSAMTAPRLPAGEDLLSLAAPPASGSTVGAKDRTGGTSGDRTDGAPGSAQQLSSDGDTRFQVIRRRQSHAQSMVGGGP
jgi:hypothetical protein